MPRNVLFVSRFEVEVKFSIPTIVVEPPLDISQTAIADVAKAILEANRGMEDVWELCLKVF